VAKTLVFYATTARYDFKIYDLGTTYQSFDFTPPVQVYVGDWDISYQPQDNILPGIVPSTASVSFYLEGATPTIDDFRQVFLTATPEWVLEITEGVDAIWRGFVTPDLGQIEVINGKRFIKVVASDGFQMLEKRADYIQLDTVIPFTDYIAQIFTFCKIAELFAGFYISEAFAPYGVTTTEGGLYWTGTIRNGLAYTDGEPRTSKDIVLDICKAFNVQMFQDKGAIIFRSCHLTTPAYYNYYDSGGDFVGKIYPPAATQSLVVYSDGTEMYKPAVREVLYLINQPSSNYIKDEGANFKNRVNYFVNDATPTGANHIRYNATLRARLSFDAGFTGDTIEIEYEVQIKFGNYYWNGSDWTTTVSTATFTKHEFVPGPGPLIHDIEKSVNNYDLDLFPSIGTQQIYITVTAAQVSGYNADSITTTSTLLMIYHNAFPDQLPHYADNTLRQNGVDVRLENEMGDIPGAAVVATTPGQIQRFISAPRTSAVGNIAWDVNGRYLANLVAEQIARKSFRSHQYYELELDGNVTYNHTTLWGTKYYKPINLSISERSTRVTYREVIDGDLLAAPI
jgi:hypothetical protein